MKVQAESEKIGKAGRGQTLQDLVGHHVHWGLYPNINEKSLKGEPYDSTVDLGERQV